jgi:hypothetical protein
MCKVSSPALYPEPRRHHRHLRLRYAKISSRKPAELSAAMKVLTLEYELDLASSLIEMKRFGKAIEIAK